MFGGFTDDIFSLLKDDADLIREVAELLLNEHFPETIHEDILNAVGLHFDFVERKRLDPELRRKIFRHMSTAVPFAVLTIDMGSI